MRRVDNLFDQFGIEQQQQHFAHGSKQRQREHTFWSSIAIVNNPTQTDVRDLGIEAGCKEDVGALDVQVQDVAAVQVSQTTSDVQCNALSPAHV